MFRKDYIIRIIEEFGILWARFVEHMRGGEINPARLTLDLAYQRILGMTSDEVLALTPGELVARLHLSMNPEAARDQCLILAALLQGEADLALREDQKQQAILALNQALGVVRAIERMPSVVAWPEYTPRSSDLEQRIANLLRS
ncbi:MAG: hypothetical protein Fur005_34520 [Roseiflexaceae bacterium]